MEHAMTAFAAQCGSRVSCCHWSKDHGGNQNKVRIVLSGGDHLHDSLQKLGSEGATKLVRCELSDAPANNITWTDAHVGTLSAWSDSLVHLELKGCGELQQPKYAIPATLDRIYCRLTCCSSCRIVCPSLQSLCVSDCPRLSERTVEAFFAQCLSVRDVRIINCALFCAPLVASKSVSILFLMSF
jgi:hypothetical protein